MYEGSCSLCVFQIGFSFRYCRQLPVDGVDFILGNDLAGGHVFPYPIVSARLDTVSGLATMSPVLFPACAVTRSQSQKFADDTVDLSNSFLLCSNPAEFMLSVDDNVVRASSDVHAQGMKQLTSDVNNLAGCNSLIRLCLTVLGQQ